MAARTYTPTLRVVTAVLKKFIARYQVKLQQNLGAEGYTLLLALLAAADQMLIYLGEAEINP